MHDCCEEFYRSKLPTRRLTRAICARLKLEYIAAFCKAQRLRWAPGLEHSLGFQGGAVTLNRYLAHYDEIMGGYFLGCCLDFLFNSCTREEGPSLSLFMTMGHH